MMIFLLVFVTSFISLRITEEGSTVVMMKYTVWQREGRDTGRGFGGGGWLSL